MVLDWQDELGPKARRKEIRSLRDQLREKLLDPRWDSWRKGMELSEGLRAKSFGIDGDWVRFGNESDLNVDEADRLLRALRAFLPWKKGPYEIFGHRIDSEWRSDLKWQRVLPFLGNLKDQFIADIGCHNGYFMYRMQELGARQVLGFEPMPIHYFNHRLLQNLWPISNIHMELFGVEHIDLFTESFDTIFCMGILYHHTDPVGLLRKMRSAMTGKGQLVIDCQGIAGDQPVSLTPNGRYAGAAGVWFLPTLRCLQNWVRRAGFSQQTVVYSEPLSIEEQRATEWANVKSLKDFLDPEDFGLTIEGHPAPWRHYLVVRV